ncbi:MAG TPA: lyase family protein [Candidatus Paceibacterota bacterium]
MHERYESQRIKAIFSTENKLNLWQKVEIVVVEAREVLGSVSRGIAERMRSILTSIPIDIAWWKAEDKKIKHDLNAFVNERVQHLPPNLARHFHEDMTSYDTEESAFIKLLEASVREVEGGLVSIKIALGTLARRHRYTLMLGTTHGQWAELQSFGKRVLTWCQELEVACEMFESAKDNLRVSRLAGAIGNYTGITPALEREALNILGFQPFYGSTQIMPRVLYVPLATALCSIVSVLDKIAGDIRLGARSGNPICQEPFAKQQTGSSAMPQKRNPITCEQMAGMARMARGYLSMIVENIKTWEERAIEQSCVERVAWPDLFHVTLNALSKMTNVIEGLRVYPDNMLRQVMDSKGTYAAALAKDFLREHGEAVGLSTDDAYRIIQLAAFNAFKPDPWSNQMRETVQTDFSAADALMFSTIPKYDSVYSNNIREIIFCSQLEVSPDLAASKLDVARWNESLSRIFAGNLETTKKWRELFLPSRILKNEHVLFKEILGE